MSKPQAAVKDQEAAKKPEVTDNAKLKKTITPLEEKPGIQTVIPALRNITCFGDYTSILSFLYLKWS